MRDYKKWTLEAAEDFFNKAEELSRDGSCDYMREILFDLNADVCTLDYIIRKFPEFKSQHERIKTNCEVICFRNLKRGKIPVAVGIFNLKVNHEWIQPAEGSKEPPKPSIKVEGVDNDELQTMLKKGE